jgi:hypothetical protein
LTPNRYISRTPKINYGLRRQKEIENRTKISIENEEENNLQKEQKKFVQDYKIFLANLGK